MKFSSLFCVLVFGIVNCCGLSCQKKTEISSNQNNEDLTKFFTGTFNGICIRTFKHPSFFSDTIAPATVIITQVDSVSMKVKLTLNGLYIFENTDTAFSNRTFRTITNTSELSIQDSGILIKEDSLYFHSYRQEWTNYTFINYEFAGKK